VEGRRVDTPLRSPENPARALDARSRGDLVYIMDLNADAQGRPVILYLTARHHKAGPKGDPRMWHTLYWTGREWQESDITTSTNNYDLGSLYVENDGTWRVIGTTEAGPQPHGTGGEVAMWVSANQGRQWRKARVMTRNSKYNHTYVRRPVPAHPEFYGFWADGHTDEESPSSLYFCNQDGDVFKLPRQMNANAARPERLQQ
jgi:hypothetical protein